MKTKDHWRRRKLGKEKRWKKRDEEKTSEEEKT